jgi:RNA polymerase sigma-70 factor (ECF subfamily)
MTIAGNIVREVKQATPAAGPGIPSPSEIKALVKEAAGGNFQAFGNLYSIYMGRIYRYVYYQVKDKMTAEDITEEVFVKAWKVIRSCRGREDTFQAWLYRIAHNRLADSLRDAGRVTSLEKDGTIDIADPCERIESGVEYQELLKAITGLPETQRQVVILKFVEGLDNRETGKALGKSEGAVRIAQMRALEALRNKLGEKRQENGEKASCNAR